jgi:hypothetical protein
LSYYWGLRDVVILEDHGRFYDEEFLALVDGALGCLGGGLALGDGEVLHCFGEDVGF